MDTEISMKKNSDSIIVIQARTNSSRLPCKVILPIKGIPIAVLAAQRAANTERKVIVATSKEKSDDLLVRELKKWDIPYYRGSLNNVLRRIVDGLSSFDDDTVIFRLTADNVFPDGKLIDELEQNFHANGSTYLSCSGVHSGLPYGVSAEVFKLSDLREADINTEDEYDREHVTPYIIRKYGFNDFTKYQSHKSSIYRCTIDNFDDYQTVSSVFECFKDPVNAPLFKLVDQLKRVSPEVTVSSSMHKLVLGTAQLGMDYGINNLEGQPNTKESEKIIKFAISNGIEYLDTAREYGNSENVIGKSLEGGWANRVKIITKLSALTALSDFPDTVDKNIVNAFVDKSIYESMFYLNQKQIDVLLLHRFQHLMCWNNSVWERLVYHKQQSRIKSLGVSVQSPEELIEALKIKNIEYIQLPFNILDNRWVKAVDKILKEKQERSLKIHVRSIYLQGLLLSDDAQKWRKAGVANYNIISTWLNDLVLALNRNSVADLCIAYINSIDWVDGLVIGMETVEQFKENVELISNIKLDTNQITKIESSRPEVPESLLNPAKWEI